MPESLLFQASGGSGTTNVTTLTIPVTSNPLGAGNKKIMVTAELVRIGSTVPRTFNSVEFASVITLNSDDQQTNSASPGTRGGIFSANLGSLTTLGDVVITASGLCRIFATVYIFDGLDQLVAVVTNKSTGLGPLAVTVDGAVIGCIANSGNNYALTDAGTQTLATGTPIAVEPGLTNEINYASGYILGGSGSQAFTWTSPNTKATHLVAGYARVAGGGSTPAPTALAASGSSTLSIGARARATTALSASGTGSLSIAARATARSAVTMSGTATMALAARALARVALPLTGTSAASIAARASAVTSVAIAGTSSLSISFASDADLTATPARTFVAGSRARTYSRGGGARIFILDTRGRTFT